MQLASSRLNANVAMFRRELLGAEPAFTLRNLFTDLRRLSRCEVLYDNTDRGAQCGRLRVDRTRGEGTWELFRLDPEAYVVVADAYYQSKSAELVPGEGLIEFHLRLAGVLELRLPGTSTPVNVTGPSLLVLYQPPGVHLLERVLTERRDTCVSVYCSPQYLIAMLKRHGVSLPAFLGEIQHQRGPAVWSCQGNLAPAMHFIGQSLVHSPYSGGLRVMHAEAKVLELFCEIASADDGTTQSSPTLSEVEARQLDEARLLLARQFTPPPQIAELASHIGMSASKLKRTFKARFGVTVFDYGLDCRMREALELLRCNHLSVGQVAHRVGYSHQTSFTAAFRDHFGFLPKDARNALHSAGPRVRST